MKTMTEKTEKYVPGFWDMFLVALMVCAIYTTSSAFMTGYINSQHSPAVIISQDKLKNCNIVYANKSLPEDTNNYRWHESVTPFFSNESKESIVQDNIEYVKKMNGDSNERINKLEALLTCLLN